MAYCRHQFSCTGKDINPIKDKINKSMAEEGFSELPYESKQWRIIGDTSKAGKVFRVDVLLTNDIEEHNKFMSLANGRR